MNIYRRKLLNAVLFFAGETKHANLTKMSKLLYFLDFTHFKETGYPSIGLTYYAFEKGPVPKAFWLEVKDGNAPPDLRGDLVVVQKEDELNPEYKEVEFRAKSKPDMSVFTPREQRIMEQLAFIYKDATAREMSEISHLPNEPWARTKEKSGDNKPIDYMLAIESAVDSKQAAESLREHFETIKNLKIEPNRVD